MESEQKIRSEVGKACFGECEISGYGAVKQAFTGTGKRTGVLDVLYNNDSVFPASDNSIYINGAVIPACAGTVKGDLSKTSLDDRIW